MSPADTIGNKLKWMTGLVLVLAIGLGCTGTAAAQNAAGDSSVATPDESDRLSGSSGDLDLTPEDRITKLNMAIERDPRNGDLYNDLGVVYAELEDWFTARDAFISAIQTKPMEADFHRNLGLVLVKLEDYEAAAREFEAYKRFDLLGNMDGPRLIGDAMKAAGRSDEAIASWMTGLEAFGPDLPPEGFRLVSRLVDLWLERNQSADARRLLEKYLPSAEDVLEAARRDGLEEPQGPVALKDQLMGIYLEDGQVLEDSGLPAEAAELYSKAFELAPQHGEILVRMVQQYVAAGDIMKAKVTARLARNEYPGMSGAWMATGYIFEAENHFQQAVEAYVKCREMSPGNVDLDLRIGNLYMKLGNGAEARRYLRSGIESQTASAEVVYNYGVSLLREKQYGLAVSPLRRAVTMKPELEAGWRALAQALRRTGRYEEAVSAYEKALAFGEDERILFNMGVCQGKCNRVDGAVASYRRVIELDPSFKSAYKNLSSILFRSGRYADAVDAYEAQLAIDSKKFEIYFNQGFSLYQLGRYEESLVKYELALGERESADLFNNIGLVYDKMGDKEQARTYYKLAKEM